VTELLINNIYPLEYFSLVGTDEPQYPDTFWWSSVQRFARVEGNIDGVPSDNYDRGGQETYEVLELDLGRTRQINYVNFDILRAPIDIKIEYDVVSSPDRIPAWVGVQPVSDDLSYDNAIYFDANNRNAWFNADLIFTNNKGQMVHTRYLRITFTRRDEPWPTGSSEPFKWPVFVKHLRCGRYVSKYLDTVGPLLEQETPTDAVEEEISNFDEFTTFEVRQRFVVPPSSLRDDIVPNVLGFGVLVNISGASIQSEGPSQAIEGPEFNWSVWDVTEPDIPLRIRSGIETRALNTGKTWIDFYLGQDLMFEADPTRVYELRILSKNNAWCSMVYTKVPNTLSVLGLPGTLDFALNSTNVDTSDDLTTYLSVGDWITRVDELTDPFVITAIDSNSLTLNIPYPNPSESGVTCNRVFPFSEWDANAGDYVENASQNLVMRVWGDVGDEGKDVLGNAYRYGVRREKASYVFDGNRAGWMSAPLPSPNAVEALYFDVRKTSADTGVKEYQLIDAMRIAPRTPGVRMNIYYTKENLDGDKPQRRNEWDYMLWSPVSTTSYTLRRDEIIEFPTPIRASYMKLEFTNLRPLPWRVPSYPPLPTQEFATHPSWVERQYDSALQQNVDAWFLRAATPVQIQVLETLKDPILEFEYKHREFQAALALGQIADDQLISSQLVTPTSSDSPSGSSKDLHEIDSITGRKVWLNTPRQYQSSLLLSVDQETVLGQTVVGRFDSSRLQDPIEAFSVAGAGMKILPFGKPTWLGGKGDIFNEEVIPPMQFNQTVRHVYRQEQAEFNKKAYFVGIEEVQFLRSDYTVRHDDLVIQDILYDDQMLINSTWSHETMTAIPDPLNVWVSYRIGETLYENEEITLSNVFPFTLEGRGLPLFNLLVYSLPDEQGLQYFQNDDYQVHHIYDEDGILLHQISRSNLTERLAIPEQVIQYVDAALVRGVGHIPGPPTYDEGMVTGEGVPITSSEGPYEPDYGTGTFGGGIYSDLRSNYADTGMATGDGAITGIEGVLTGDLAVVIGIGVVTADEEFVDV